jgi:tRNA nucleotidyltransferase (CCA-adding enzyme)
LSDQAGDKARDAASPASIVKSTPEPVLALCRELARAGHQAFLVGGAIRDLLLGREVHDFDIATSAHPDEVTRVFGRRRTIPTGAAHGTVSVLIDKATAEQAGLDHPAIEVTTFRGEGAYADGRRPDRVEFLDDIVEDLRRRDFTVNAIAVDPATGALCDPFDGRVDLAAQRLRAVGDPAARFAEDGLRVMRGVRLCAQLGFALDPATEAAIPGALDVFRRVSAERVRDELLKLLAAPVPSVGLRLMQKTGMLAVVLPELIEGAGHPQNRFHAYDVLEHTLRTVDETRGDAITRLGALLHDVAKPRTAAPKEGAPGEFTFFRHEHVGAGVTDAIARRLRLSNKERERVVALVENHMFWYTPEWSDGAVRRFIGRVGVEGLDDLFALREGDVRARGHGEDPAVEVADLRRRIADELASQRAFKLTDLAVGGADVMQVLGRPPGPIVGAVLRRLLERVLDEPELNDRERLLALIPEVAAEEDRAHGGGA